MAFAFVGDRGSAAEKVLDTSLQMTVATANLPVDAIAVVWAAVDSQALDNGPSTHLSLADSGGNSWTKIIEESGNSTLLGDHVTVAMWISKLTTGLTSGTSTLTVTVDNAVTAKVMALTEYSVGAGNTFTIPASNKVAAQGTGTSIASTLSGLSSISRLWLGLAAWEGTGADFSSDDADYTLSQERGTSGGAAPSNIRARHLHRIATLTGDTFTTTLGTSRDWMSLLVAVEEVSGGQSAALGTASETDTAPALARAKAKLLGVASEADTAPALARAKAKLLGIASEADTALPITAPGPALGIASEADQALPLGRAKAAVLGIASEADQALALSGVHSKLLGVASETDEAPALGVPQKALVISPAVETDTAGVLTPVGGGGGGGERRIIFIGGD